MKFNSTTYWISIITLMLYSVYIMSAMGLTGLLLSLAIGLISAAFFDAIEIVTSFIVILGIFYVFLTRWMTTRTVVKYVDSKKEGFSDGSPKEILTLMDTMEQKKYGKDRKVTPVPWADLHVWPTGILGDGVEGFADVSQPNDASAKEGAPAESTPASPEKKDMKDEDEKKMKEATTAPKPDEKPKTDGFQSNQTGLFKLGELPSESAEGPHIDAGTTLMKAMSALNPDQINSMTSDTKSLLETQQNLMGMLKNMQPILQDGRKLLDSFSGIFGGSNDFNKAADGALGGSKGYYKVDSVGM